jgi:uncharacterized protein (DUF433 family)
LGHTLTQGGGLRTDPPYLKARPPTSGCTAPDLISESSLEFKVHRRYLQPMIATSYRYIVQRAGVRSGHPIVEGTRIGVHDVIGLLQNGETVDTIVSRCFPNLTRAQVYECLAYYEDHRGEIDLLVARQTAADTP